MLKANSEMSRNAYVSPSNRTDHKVQSNVPEFDISSGVQNSGHITPPGGNGKKIDYDFKTPKSSVLRMTRKGPLTNISNLEGHSESEVAVKNGHNQYFHPNSRQMHSEGYESNSKISNGMSGNEPSLALSHIPYDVSNTHNPSRNLFQDARPANVYMEHPQHSTPVGMAPYVYSSTLNGQPVQPVPVTGISHGATAPSSLASQLSSINLTQWQQKHQEQLRRQQNEITKVSSHNLETREEDPHKWDALRRVADNIIKEKDMVIDRQKLKILQLESQSRDRESQLQTAMYWGDNRGDKFNLQLEEYQYEAASCKAQLAEMSAIKDQQINALQTKLGKMEYDLQQYKVSSSSNTSSKDKEIKDLKHKVKSYENQFVELKGKYKQLEKESNERKLKLKSLNRYLEDLPTPDEDRERNIQLENLKKEVSQKKDKVMDLEKKATEMKRFIKTKDDMIEALEEQEKELTSKVASSQVEIEEMKNQRRLEREEKGTTKLEAEIEEMKWKNKKLISEVEKAKQILDGKEKKIRKQEGKHQMELVQLKDNVGEGEQIVASLRKEISAKDSEVNRIKKSLKEVVKQNQELMDDSITLQERVKDAEKLLSSETRKLEHNLIKEMNACFTDLQSLVQICVERAEGQDPNMSVLLGMRVPSVSETEADLGSTLEHSVQVIKCKVKSIRQLRRDIDQLRELISNKYAEDMGDNLNCTTQ